MRLLLTIPFIIICHLSHAQLSEGEGERKIIGDGLIEIYVPRYFKISEQPLGLIHNTSRTMIYIIPVPKEHYQSIDNGNGKELLIDQSMKELTIHKRSGNQFGRINDDVEFMEFEIEGVKFERLNSFIKNKGEIYLLFANYPVILKNQVFEEVQKIYGSIKFLK